MLFMLGSVALAQNLTFTTRVIVRGEHAKTQSSKDVVVWLTPLDTSAPALRQDQHFRLVQHNKSFVPHILVVPVGAVVEFPNRDPFFHNVFSLFEGKRFDLGLYEAGSTREVHFDRPGISYIFCNIHAQMSAVVVSLTTPYYGVSNSRGEISIQNVPAGHYKLQVWYERAPEPLKTISREITISQNGSSLPPIQLQAANLSPAHKNKYGHDYEPPQPASPAYEQP